MSFDLSESLEILRRAPTVYDALLRGSAPAWHTADEGPDTWSPIDVLGHLVHGEETDWIPRARILLEHGTSRPFEPFDRFAQDRRFAGWTLDRLLDRFAECRRESIDTLTSWDLTDEQLARVGEHPELGSVTLRQLLATWVAHDLGHLAQVSRAMAKRHRDDVGPWQAYLSVLHRGG
ncbi:MAG: DinB family protein [Acidobacteriota bacterium]